jgi:hypothetical protein
MPSLGERSETACAALVRECADVDDLASFIGRRRMRPEDPYRMLHQRPFQPFRIYLSDGHIFDIRYPKINMVGGSYIVIGHCYRSSSS